MNSIKDNKSIDIVSKYKRITINYQDYCNKYFGDDIYCHYCFCRLKAIKGSDGFYYITGKHNDNCISELAGIRFLVTNNGYSKADFSFLERINLIDSNKPDFKGGSEPGGNGKEKKDYKEYKYIQTNNDDYINNAFKYLQKYNARATFLDDGTDLKEMFPQLYNFNADKIVFENKTIAIKCEKKPRELYIETKEGYACLIAKFGLFNEYVAAVYIKMINVKDHEKLIDTIKNKAHYSKEIFIVSNKWKKTKSKAKDIAFVLETILPNSDCYYPIYL